MNKPEWLADFPFLMQHWESVLEISGRFPYISEYDLDQDWRIFLKQKKATQSAPNWFQLLRQFRQSRLAYIGYLDIHRPLEKHLDSMHLVAALADFLIQVAYELAVAEMSDKHGLVRDEHNQKIELLVFALGKLGTRELNYSSDVDLVFLYEGEGASNGKRSLAAADYFIRLGQRLIKYLDYFSTDGQVYRVDMRLRPFGSSAPLVCSLTAFQNYLIHEGRDWERFAWMRARQVCGNKDNGVKEIIQPFIYRRHLDYQVFDALAAIKTEIAGHAKIEADNIKLGIGGIRVIEFIIQSLQLVFGGRHNQLRSSEIYPQIDNLASLGKLDAISAESIRKTWLVLRKIENLAQLVNDQANHDYPESDEVLSVAGVAIGYQDWSSALLEIKQSRTRINEIFNRLLSVNHEVPDLSEQQMITANQLMKSFATSRLPQSRLEQVNEILRIAVQQSDDALVLNHLSDLLKKILSRPAYILMLLKERNLLKKVLKLFSRNEYFAEQLIKHPVLLEQLFEYEKFELFSDVSLSIKWQSHLQNHWGTEQWMESTRFFKNAQQFNLMMAWSDNTLDDEVACQQLTLLARFIVGLVVHYSHQEIVQKLNHTMLRPDQLIVIAYGSAAVGTMHVDSDLDLVFVLDVESIDGSERIFAQKWVRRIIHHLNSQMYNGKLYELDMQLRPNGNSGALITTCHEFELYQANEAWIWEHAALIKSKPIFATNHQISWHQLIRHNVLTQKRSDQDVDSALNEMAAKLAVTNKASGHDGEFHILSSVLKHASSKPEIVEHHDLDLIQQKLLDLNLVSASQINLKGTKKGPIKN